MNIRQKKSLSQVFLKETWPVERMIHHVRERGIARVLEIGPGAGVLTTEALNHSIHVTAIEADHRFAEKLPLQYPQHQDRLKVIHADILQFDLMSWIEESSEPSAVIGNIPYHISTPILEWVLPHLDRLKGAFFLTQLEFAKRICASHGNKDYGSISVFTQLRSKTELLFEVPRTCFKPVPKVDSAVLALAKSEFLIDSQVLNFTESLCRKAFMQRRKKLSNSIAIFLDGIDREQLPFDLTLRPEQLSPSDFVRLAEILMNS